MVLVCVFAMPPGLALGAGPARSALVLVERTVMQEQGAWVLDYRLRHTGQAGVIITPEEFVVKVEGWVSNSRVASHAVPRWSSLVISRSRELLAIGDVIATADESQRCRERLLVSIWDQGQGHIQASHSVPSTAKPGASPAGGLMLTEPVSLLPLSLAPEATVRVRLRLEHQHFLHGDYDPLLAVRIVELTIGPSAIRDVVSLDREQYLAQPRSTWPEPPEDRRDTRHSISGPDSLHLEADIPGHQYYRYPERPVRYNTKMRLRFWYLIAVGTEGECRAHIAQASETATSWRPLKAGDFDQCLKTIGRWTKVERIFQTEPEATTLGLEFKIVGETEVGEMWIDDVSLEPVYGATAGGP
jgi:hypothetical protein